MEKASEVSASLIQASSFAREIALPHEGGKRALQKIKMKLPRWSYRRVKSVFYAEYGTRVDADELKELETAAKREKRAATLAREDEEAGNEIRELRERLARIESLSMCPRRLGGNNGRGIVD